MELELFCSKSSRSPVAELAAEDAAECLHGQEEARRGIDPSGAVGSQAAGGNDVVDMGMMLEVLSPGMQHAEEADVGSKVLGIASQFEQRRGAGCDRAGRRAAACSAVQERRARAAA